MSFWSILPSVLSILSTIIIALVGWGFRTTIAELQGKIKSNAENLDKLDIRHSERMSKLETNFNDLKSDLPLIYVLREDFVRTMNNVETRIAGMDGKLDRLLEKTAKGGKIDG